MKDFELNKIPVAGIYKNLDRDRLEIKIEKELKQLSVKEARQFACWLYDAADQIEYADGTKKSPQQKADEAYQSILRMQEANRKICELGVCIHKEHQK